MSTGSQVGGIGAAVGFLQVSGTSPQSYRMTSKNSEEESGVEFFSLSWAEAKTKKEFQKEPSEPCPFFGPNVKCHYGKRPERSTIIYLIELELSVV